MSHLMNEAARYHGSGGGYALSLFFRWLWHQIGWWSMFIIGPLTALGLWGTWSVRTSGGNPGKQQGQTRYHRI